MASILIKSNKKYYQARYTYADDDMWIVPSRSKDFHNDLIMKKSGLIKGNKRLCTELIYKIENVMTDNVVQPS